MNILLAEADGFSAAALATLRGCGDVVAADLDRPALLAAVADADVLWVRLRNRIDDQVLSAARRLKILVTPTTGLNHIDLPAAARRGVQVLSLRGETEFLKDVRATAELTIGLILSALRHIPAATAHAAAGEWNRDAFTGQELYGKTVGIVGYGRLGQIVTRYLQAFDAKILVSDPDVDLEDVRPGVSRVGLERLLPDADVVSLHVNLCDDTVGFFGREQFAAMKPGAWFVNTSRGELVDESALLAALESGRLSGAAVDVLSGEDAAGMGDHPLVQFAARDRRLLITPHLGGCTRESMEKTERFLAERLRQALSAAATA